MDNLGTLWTRRRVSSPDTRHPLAARGTLHDVNEYDPARDGELLPARDVCSLLHIARSTLPLWRDRGDLIGYKGRNGHWRYPSKQPTLAEARAALRVGGARPAGKS